MTLKFSVQDALIAVMVGVSASDETVSTPELVEIQVIVNSLPVFADYDVDRIRAVSDVVFDFFSKEDGIVKLIDLVKQTLPAKLHETAYAMACDVAAADGRLDQEELLFLQDLRYELNIDRLHSAAIERGARARHMTL